MRFLKIKLSQKEKEAVRLNSNVNFSETHNLGKVVALFGENGSGKTRILDLVVDYVNHMHFDDFNNDNFGHSDLDKIKQQIATQLTISTITSSSNNPFTKNLQQYAKKREEANHSIKNYILKYIKIIRQQDLHSISLRLNDKFNLKDIVSIENYLKQKSSDATKDSIHAFIKSKNDLAKAQKLSENSEAGKLITRFSKWVKKLLGAEFSYEKTNDDITNLDCHLLLDGKPLIFEKLSPGQRVLFSYAVLFFQNELYSGIGIEESILIIDEPELHLHPSAQLELIKLLKDLISEKGQLFIASHSLHILSYLEKDEIYVVDKDNLYLPSNGTPNQALDKLMGDTVDKLQRFISSRLNWQYYQFMLDCLNDPNVILNLNANDSQFLLLKNYLESKKQSNTKIRFLDFGAGLCRIGYLIKQDKSLNSFIEYNAYQYVENKADISSEKNKLMQIIPSANIHINDLPSNKKFDVILLCNVLHEIDPLKWESEFRMIKKGLSDDGVLIIIEDRDLPHGEHAHDYGYLILEETQMNILFQNNTTFNRTERMVFYPIFKNNINITPQSIIDAIESLNESKLLSIRDIRLNINSSKKETNLGSKYANQTQLYINSLLALEQLKKNIDKGQLSISNSPTAKPNI